MTPTTLMKSTLIIEQDPIYQIRLSKIVEAEGFEPLLISLKAELQEVLKSQEFDLLICNIELENGEICNVEGLPDVPIIFITASERIDYMEAALNIPHAHFLVKPFSDLTLRAAIRNINRSNQEPGDGKYITVFGKHKNPINILISDIEFIESQGNYSYVFTSDNLKYAVKKSSKQLMIHNFCELSGQLLLTGQS